MRTSPKKSTEKSAEKVLLAKMHHELDDKQRCARNVIVRGLKPVDGVDDLSVFFF